MINLKIEKLIAECDKHLKRINSAHSKMAAYMPMDAIKFQQLNEDEIEHIDQFLFRFAKLQDTLGEKLFILLLEFLKEENTKNKPFIDILNRLEQLGLLVDKNSWLELRKIRNTIAHQYEDEPQQAAEALNAIYVSKATLETIYTTIKTRYTAMRHKS